MAYLNKVFLMGNLTRNPELRYTPSGTAICEMGMAMSRRYTQNGQEREEVCFVDVVVWDKQGESCSKFLQKGSPVFVEGRLQFDQWTDKEQKKRSRIRITAERVQFLGNGPRQDGGAPEQGGYQPRQRQVPNDGYPNSYRQQYQQPAPQQQYGRSSSALPPQMPPAESYGYDDPTRTPQPRRSMPDQQPDAQQAPPDMPPPPVEDVQGMEDDIPF